MARHHTYDTPRRHPRVRVVGRALVHADHGITACDVIDMSLGGLLLSRAPEHSHEPIPEVGETVLVELHLASEGSRWYGVGGEVCRRAAADRFALRLGRVPPDLEDEIEEEVLAAVEASASPRVVVVDVPGDRRRKMAETVRRSACVPIVASTPLDAIRRLEESRTHAAAVIVGEELTQTHGDELVRYIASEHPGVRVALIHEPGHEEPEVSDGVVMMAPEDCDHSEAVRVVIGRGEGLL
ncbi:MAG: PilZ domain-containing protein [Deltaproteobacteria bacterium]|nr:PilZ domain-containing protein [Kofleriaceae bacterium]